MRFIIYGAGKRGKDESKAVGKENVVAFLDQDSSKIGTSYNGIPILDIMQAQEKIAEAAVIITPIFGRKAIAACLQNCGIQNYLFMQPFDQMLLYEKENIFSMILEQYKGKKIGIYGISAGSILLYEFLSKRADMQVCMILDDVTDADQYDFLKKEIRILDLEEA